MSTSTHVLSWYGLKIQLSDINRSKSPTFHHRTFRKIPILEKPKWRPVNTVFLWKSVHNRSCERKSEWKWNQWLWNDCRICRKNGWLMWNAGTANEGRSLKVSWNSRHHSKSCNDLLKSWFESSKKVAISSKWRAPFSQKNPRWSVLSKTWDKPLNVHRRNVVRNRSVFVILVSEKHHILWLIHQSTSILIQIVGRGSLSTTLLSGPL
jgi:hypothetical protein